jgi:hypothetical protein
MGYELLIDCGNRDRASSLLIELATSGWNGVALKGGLNLAPLAFLLVEFEKPLNQVSQNLLAMRGLRFASYQGEPIKLLSPGEILAPAA